MRLLRSRLVIVLFISFSILSGCGNKSQPQTSNPQAEGDKPTWSDPLGNEQILNGIRDIVAKQLSLDAGAVDVDAPLSKQKIAADELDVVEIVMNVEDMFGIEIKDEEFSNPEGHLKDNLSVRNLADIVARKKKGK